MACRANGLSHNVTSHRRRLLQSPSRSCGPTARFPARLPVETGEIVERDGFIFADVLPAGLV
jgi:hypothetical protein